MEIDVEGLQVAYLDDSGRIEHYLDLASGEVVDFLDGDPAAASVRADSRRYRPVPRRTAESDAADRRAFAERVEDPAMQMRLRSAADALEFRRAVSLDRTVERAWYAFKNDRATAAIEAWLAALDA